MGVVMRPLLVAARAFGEAIFWGIIAGAIYGLVFAQVTGGFFDGVDLWGGFLYFGAMFGFFAGVLSGVLGAVVAGIAAAVTTPRTAERSQQWRVLGAFSAGLPVLAAALLMVGTGFGLDSEVEWREVWLIAVVPSLIAAAIAAWRAPAIVQSRVPRFVPKGTPPPAVP